MDTALYYTFSTISQTLAGAIALLGAFVLYRFQIHKEKIREIGIAVNRTFAMAHWGIWDSLIETGQYDLLIQQWESKKDSSHSKGAFEKHLKRFRHEMQLRSKLIPKLKTALWLTILIIIYSVLILILTPFISCSKLLTYGIFLIGFISLLFCFWSYYRLIVATILESE